MHRHCFSPCTRADPAVPPMPPVDDLPKFAFHRDGGFEGWWTERPSPRVTAKAIYYISDCSVAGRGNTWCADQRRPMVFIRVLTPHCRAQGRPRIARARRALPCQIELM